MKLATNLLRQAPSGLGTVFVHVRRGDYATHSVYGKTGVELPLSYYREAITAFPSERTCFVFVSDDIQGIESQFNYLPCKLFSRLDTAGDLAVMAACDGGILSCSSFSWWGAALMRPSSPVIAPKYWLGFKSKAWFPDDFRADFAQFMDVLE